MDISALSAARGYGQNRPATAPSAGEAARRAAEGFAETLQRGETTAKDAMMGQADPHALVQSLSEARFAVDAAVAVRDKVVEAYQEILRMPV